MLIGVPKEIKNRENRVSAVPGGVQILTQAGHKVMVEKGAGLGAGIPDEKYKAAGATIIDNAAKIWADAELIIKVILKAQAMKDRVLSISWVTATSNGPGPTNTPCKCRGCRLQRRFSLLVVRQTLEFVANALALFRGELTPDQAGSRPLLKSPCQNSLERRRIDELKRKVRKVQRKGRRKSPLCVSLRIPSRPLRLGSSLITSQARVSVSIR